MSGATEDTQGTSQYLHDLMEKFAPVLGEWGYPIVFVAILVEGFGIPAPGLSLFIVATLMAFEGTSFDPVVILVVGWVAATVGNIIGYAIGYYGGHAMIDRFKLEKHIVRFETFFDKYGIWLILFARFLDGVRQFNGIAAGCLNMGWWRFFVFNILGATVWIGFFYLLVFELDKHYHDILVLSHKMVPEGWWIASVVVVLFVLLLWWFKRKSRVQSD